MKADDRSIRDGCKLEDMPSKNQPKLLTVDPASLSGVPERAVHRM